MPNVRKVFDEIASQARSNRRRRRRRRHITAAPLLSAGGPARQAPPTDLIFFDNFSTVIIEKLMIGLSEVELGRVWDGLTPEQVGVPREARTLNFDGFSAGLGQITFLRDVMTEWVLQSEPWKIPDEYDYEKSSNDNYGAPPASW